MGHTRGHQPQPITIRLRWRSSQSYHRQRPQPQNRASRDERRAGLSARPRPAAGARLVAGLASRACPPRAGRLTDQTTIDPLRCRAGRRAGGDQTPSSTRSCRSVRSRPASSTMTGIAARCRRCTALPGPRVRPGNAVGVASGEGQTRAPRDRTLAGLVMGHHQAPWPGKGHLVPPLRPDRHLLALLPGLPGLLGLRRGGLGDCCELNRRRFRPQRCRDTQQMCHKSLFFRDSSAP